jgi:hypothetical protein
MSLKPPPLFDWIDKEFGRVDFRANAILPAQVMNPGMEQRIAADPVVEQKWCSGIRERIEPTDSDPPAARPRRAHVQRSRDEGPPGRCGHVHVAAPLCPIAMLSTGLLSNQGPWSSEA